MPEFVPVPVETQDTAATKDGCDLAAIYVNPATVTMVKRNDDDPDDSSVIHFVNGETLRVAQNFGQLSATLSYPDSITET